MLSDDEVCLVSEHDDSLRELEFNDLSHGELPLVTQVEIKLFFLQTFLGERLVEGRCPPLWCFLSD